MNPRDLKLLQLLGKEVIEVVGNNFAALVCCSELVRNGISVRHVSNSDLRLGGHFSGFRFREKLIDLGMVLLEPRFETRETDIIMYEGQFGQQVNQFNHAVFGWLSSRAVSLNQIDVYSFFHNKLIGDAIIADDLTFLDLLPTFERQAIIQEITVRNLTSKCHPRDKAVSVQYKETNLRDIYHEIYGPTFSKYLLGNLELLAGPDGEKVVAQFHRLLWAPLYYPENILNYLVSGDSGLRELEFFTPSSGSVSQLIEDLVEELRMSPRYDSRTVPKAEYAKVIADGLRKESTEAIVFADEKELHAEHLNSLRSDVAFVISEVATSVELVVHNLDTNFQWYRATVRGQGLGVVVVELGKTSLDEPDDSLLLRASQCLQSIGVGALNEPMILRSQIYFFSPQISSVFQERHLKVQKLLNGNPDCYLTNETTGSFNNQVCLGLKSSQRILRRLKNE